MTPFSLRPLILDGDVNPTPEVYDIIDHDSCCWRENIVRNIFHPCEVDVILSVPLCPSWPNDKFI